MFLGNADDLIGLFIYTFQYICQKAILQLIFPEHSFLVEDSFLLLSRPEIEEKCIVLIDYKTHLIIIKEYAFLHNIILKSRSIFQPMPGLSS